MKKLNRILAQVGVTVAVLSAPLAAMATLPSPFAPGGSGATALNGVGGAAFGSTACTGSACLYSIIGNVINVALSFMGVVVLFYFLWAGWKWMTSDGEKGAGEARVMMRNAVIGLIIIVASYSISSFVMAQLVAVTTGTPAP